MNAVLPSGAPARSTSLRRSVPILLLALSSVGCQPDVPSGAPASGVVRAEPPPDPAPPDTPPLRDTAPTWRGDTCTSDAECGWDDPCFPRRCGTPTPESLAAACTRSGPPPGTCGCVEEMCTLRPADPATSRSTTGTCGGDGECAVDVATGTCHVGGRTLIGPIEQTGPVCLCREGTCELRWVDPIPCTTFAECSWAREPRLRPLRAATPRSRPVEPCVDGEVDSVCGGEEGQKTCRIVGWSC